MEKDCPLQAIAIHGIVKSPCGRGPKTQADFFMEKARTVAEEGKRLADSVKKWTAKQVSKARRAKKGS